MIQLREVQAEALRKVVSAIKSGKTDILIQAPTGVGKSLIALELAKKFEEMGSSSFILTSDKLLQQQYEEDCAGKFKDRHGEVVSISGIDNYNCHINGKKFSLGHCKNLGIGNSKALTTLPCAANCAYLQKWVAAKSAKTAVFNYSYYLIQMNYVLKKMQEMAPFPARDFVICDEAHSLPNIIESHFACTVNKNWVERIKAIQDELREEEVYIEFLGIKYGDLGRSISNLFSLKYTDSAGHLLGLTEIFNLCNGINLKIKDAKQSIRHKYKLGDGIGDSLDDFVTAAITANEMLPLSVKSFIKFADDFKDYSCKIEDYIQIIHEQGVENMVIEGSATERIYHNLCDEQLFNNHFKPFSNVRIYMSATLQPQNMIKRLGLNPHSTEIIILNSNWNPLNSPIILKNTANFKYSNSTAAIKNSISEINKILKAHENQRGIIHTTSYEILKHLMKGIKQKKRIYTYSGTAEKMELLRNLKSLPHNAVIMGPSLTQGVDLTDELAEFNIIMKLSYPNIGSALWRKRFQKKRFIYWAEAANTLEQSAGRATRHENDKSITYILDQRAKNFIKSKSTAKYFSYEFIQRLVN